LTLINKKAAQAGKKTHTRFGGGVHQAPDKCPRFNLKMKKVPRGGGDRGVEGGVVGGASNPIIPGRPGTKKKGGRGGRKGEPGQPPTR